MVIHEFGTVLVKVMSKIVMLVANGDTPECVDRWSKTLDIVDDTKDIFDKIFKTTNDTCLPWFQDKMLYRLIPTGRFLFSMKDCGFPLLCLL